MSRQTLNASAANEGAMSEKVTGDEIREVEQFLYYEAHLLDERCFEEWLALFTDDTRYWMPTRRTVAKSLASSTTTVAEELAQRGELGFFEDSKMTLFARVLRLKGGIAWAEDPPSRTRRIVTNICVARGENAGEYRVRSYFLLHRTRHQCERESFIGTRNDVLRRDPEGDAFRIASREIVLDETVLMSPNLSVFF
jgi:3-phenylpropionate/cinnamic acid dioxygenase small subunit